MLEEEQKKAAAAKAATTAAAVSTPQAATPHAQMVRRCIHIVTHRHAGTYIRSDTLLYAHTHIHNCHASVRYGLEAGRSLVCPVLIFL